MSTERLKQVFNSLKNTTDWSLQLLKITKSKKVGTKYASRQITLDPPNGLSMFVKDISESYLNEKNGFLNKYTCVTKYDGSADSTTVYRLSTDDQLISKEYASFKEAIVKPDAEADTIAFPDAYVLRGTIALEDEQTIKLISTRKPIKTYKHNWRLLGKEEGTFKELKEEILCLQPSFEVLILGSTVYFLSLKGENLFNMERAYKSVCRCQVEKIEQYGIINNIECFKSVAESGHNPRRFVSFDSERFEELKNVDSRKKRAEEYFIPLDENNKFNLSDYTDKTGKTITAKEIAQRIVDLLCKKGMYDTFKNTPVRVSSARSW